MRKSLLLIVLVSIVLATSDTLSAPAGAQRMLRPNVGGDDEERGIIAALCTRLKREVRNFKAWVIWMIMKRGQTPVPDKRIAQIQWWITRKATNEVLYKHNVYPGEYFQALKLDPKLKMYADVDHLRKLNPNLQKFFDYIGYFEYMKAVD